MEILNVVQDNKDEFIDLLRDSNGNDFSYIEVIGTKTFRFTYAFHDYGYTEFKSEEYFSQMIEFGITDSKDFFKKFDKK